MFLHHEKINYRQFTLTGIFKFGLVNNIYRCCCSGCYNNFYGSGNQWVVRYLCRLKLLQINVGHVTFHIISPSKNIYSHCFNSSLFMFSHWGLYRRKYALTWDDRVNICCLLMNIGLTNVGSLIETCNYFLVNAHSAINKIYIRLQMSYMLYIIFLLMRAKLLGEKNHLTLVLLFCCLFFKKNSDLLFE